MADGTERNVAIFATGGKRPGEGGSGLRVLMRHADIANRVGVIVTNYSEGGVAGIYENELNPDATIALEVMKNFPKRQPDGTFSAEDQEEIRRRYLELVKEYNLEYLFLSGWMKLVLGPKGNRVVNIHPGPLGKYGGVGMHGDHVHEKIWGDYFDGKIVSSAVTMHYVPPGPMDTGPIIVQVPVSLVGCTCQDDVRKRVNAMEHKIQWQITEHVINGKITWSGVSGEPVQFEKGLTIDVDGTPFPLDGKEANLTEGLDGYGNVVVKLGDQASGNFKDACDRAMKTTPAFTEGLVSQTDTGAWETLIPPSETPTRVKEDIDGVGTKVQIYLEMFEGLCRAYRDGQITQEECTTRATQMCWIPMLHDLIAMNADDLRDGQMAVSVTNIIDINHLGGMRGQIFSASMSQAMEQATTEIGIGNVAGETAVLGLSSTSHKLLDLIESDIMRNIDSNIGSGQETLANIDALIADIGSNSIDGIAPDAKAKLTARIQSQIRILVDTNLCQNLQEKEEIIAKLKQLLVFIDFNIGGTVQGLMKDEKLIPLEEGHVLIALYEQPDKNGIIGPRSNGITSIRENMKELAGRSDWAMMTFEEFLEHIGPTQANELPAELKKECAGLLLGQIATGTTTVFNPFVSRDLLGGFDGKPEVQIASIVNVTGNPAKKIKNGLHGAKDMAIDINIGNAKLPQIIEIIQRLKRLTGMSDEEAMKSWNMGVPYVLACPPSEAVTIIQKANARGITAEQIGKVVQRNKGDPATVIGGVGIGKSKIEVE